MADLSKIKLNGTTYNFKDAVARESLIAIQDSLEDIHEQESDNNVKVMLESLNLTAVDENNNIVGAAIVGKAIAQSSSQELTNNDLTNWQTGDIITIERLNKIEDALDVIINGVQ